MLILIKGKGLKAIDTEDRVYVLQWYMGVSSIRKLRCVPYRAKYK